MASRINVELSQKEKIRGDIFKFSFVSKELANEAKPGQFLEIQVSKSFEPILRRPISIYNVNEENGIVEFIFQVKGQGTKMLSELRKGDELDIIGPLGKGVFCFEGYKKLAIIGGGIGIFPLYYLAKEAKKQADTNVYLGFRSKDLVTLEDDFREVSTNLLITTDDGTYGKKGFSIQHLENDLKVGNIDAIFACGPIQMLRAVKVLAEVNAIPCQISLEERMGCGIGACLGCSVKLKVDEPTRKYARVCADGPVFNSQEVEI